MHHAQRGLTDSGHWIVSNIHPTAIVEAGARIDPSVTVGPYAVIGSQVVIGAGSSVVRLNAKGALVGVERLAGLGTLTSVTVVGSRLLVGGGQAGGVAVPIGDHIQHAGLLPVVEVGLGRPAAQQGGRVKAHTGQWLVSPFA